VNDLPVPVTQFNLRLLQTFMLVAENLSFRDAAEQTRRSQSAVSTQVKQLETQLGITLLHRTTRSVVLTPEGRELLEGTKRAMHEVNLGLRKIRESADIKRGRVSLACSPSVAANRLPQILATFKKVHPGVHISLMEQHSADIFHMVRQGDADFGIGPLVEAVDDDICFEPILEDRIMALVPRVLLANTRKTISLKELVTMPLLLHTPGSAMRRMLESAIDAQSLKFENNYQCMQMQTLVSMAVAGMGVAVLPQSVLKGVTSSNTQTLRLVDPPLTRQVCLITMRGRTLSPASAQLAQVVRELIEDGTKPSRRRMASTAH